MTIETIFKCDAPVQFRDANRLIKFARGKRDTVVESIDPLYQQFPSEVMRGMATVAGCHCLVTAVVPAVKNSHHDMAVGAGLRVVLEIRQTLSIIKSKTAQTDYPSNQANKTHQHRQWFDFITQWTAFHLL